MEKTRTTLTLRFFDVSYPSFTSENSLIEKLSGKLSSSASSRMMLLNKSDPDKSDLISDFLYTLSGKHIIAGTYLRIANSSDVPIIIQGMLAQNQFKVSTINKDASVQEKTCLDYFYFCMSDDKIIVTLDSRKTINRMDTYVNWLLNTTSTGNRLSFTPIVDSTAISAADLKKITINNGSSIFVDSGDNHQEDKENSSVIRLAKNALRKLFDETDTLDELIEENICSAQLVIRKRKAARICSFIMEVGNFGHNRDTSYYSKYHFLIRKAISMGWRICDLFRHARIFPLDSLRFLPKIMYDGLRSAVKGE